MAISEAAKAYRGKMFPNYRSELSERDPEFTELFENFAFDEVVNLTTLTIERGLWLFWLRCSAVRARTSSA